MRTFHLATYAALGALIFGAAACGDDEPSGSPTINQFEASSLTVEEGATVTLSYDVSDATTVKITATPGGEVLAPTAELKGTVTSAALTVTTKFVLDATNDQGTTSRSVTVNVTPGGTDVAIISFSASPTSVALGGMSTLSWETANATSVKIDVLGGANVLPDGAMFSGSLEVSPTPPETIYVITAQGPNGPATSQTTVTVMGAPRIVDFSANPTVIQEGESTTLSWTVENIDGLAITDSAGTEVHTDTALTGTFQVGPLSANETYTLAASRTGFPDDTATVTITVNPLQGAQIVSWTANPTSINAIGESSTLSWEVANAPGGIAIMVGGVTATTSVDLTGAWTVTPTLTTSYELFAYNPSGDAGPAVATVTVNPSAPAIVSFDASPTDVRVGEDTNLSWQTLGAGEVRVLSGTNILFQDTGAMVDSGSYLTTITSTGSHQFTLEAENTNDINRSTVTVRGWESPTIDAFDVDPLQYAGTATTATVTWSVTQAAQVELFVDGVSVATSANASGTFYAAILGSQTVELVATNPVDEARAQVTVRAVITELEPNDAIGQAQPLAGDGGGAVGSINPATDVDWYAIQVPAGGSVWAATFNGGPGVCVSGDTRLTLYASDGTTVLGTDDFDGPASCSEIDPARDTWARDLAAGTYYIVVEEDGNNATLSNYEVFVSVNGPACGNSWLETNASEQCDDGNTVSGDDCSATCQAEPIAVLTGPGASQDYVGAIQFLGNRDIYQVDMLADGYIFAETFIPELGRCDTAGGAESADSVIILYDSSFNELGRDDADGLNSCSKIDLFDPFAFVTTGTYYLAVTDDGDNDTINQYTLSVQTVGVGCGNGILEGTETCDDGNTTPGDGCGVLCNFEGSTELEPNETFTDATPLVVVPGTPLIATGGLTADDDDYFAIDVPAGYHLDVYVTVGSLASCPSDLTTQLRLYDTNGTSLIASNSTGGPNGTCGRVWPYTDTDAFEMTGGTYYLRVSETGGDPINNYFLHISVIAPGCGNTIIEGVEQCEDGNVTAGDGCSDTCTHEPIQVYTSPGAEATIAEAISPEYDMDVVEITVTAESYLFAATFSPSFASGVCTTGVDTRLRLYDDQWNEVGTDDADGVGSCSAIDPLNDAWARLSTGTYYLLAEEDGNNATIGAYEIWLRGTAVDVCGNGVPGDSVGEQCDDGNVANGDGCSATCQIEPDGTITGPGVNPAGVSQTFNVDITPAGDLAFIRLDVTAPAILRSETGVPTIGVCTAATGESSDTRMYLLDSTLTTELGFDDDGSTGLCSLFDPSLTADAFTFLDVGTYFIMVDEFGNNGVISALQIQVNLVPQDVCGNGYLEAPEFCDDGNNTPGDGCNATCGFEPIFTYTADGVTTATVTLQTIDPATQVDAYQVTVPGTSAVHLYVETFVDAATRTCPTIDTRVKLWTLAGELIGEDDLDGVGSCSLIDRSRDIWAVLAPGTYYVTVEEDGQNATISQYEIVFGSAPAGVCGDNLVDIAAGETCEDGNTTPGDGCNATCQTEWVYTGAGAPQTFSGDINPATQTDSVQVVVTGDSYILAETFVDAVAGTCNVDTRMQLWTAGGILLGEDDLDGVGSCSLFSSGDAFTLVPAGTYYVTVTEDGQNATIAAYQVVVQTAVANVCGNGVQEPGNNETCDDGNTADNDGCSSTCTTEPVVGPGPVPGVSITYNASFSTPDDTDIYPIISSADAYVIFETGVPTLGSCTAGPGNDFQWVLRDTATQTTIASDAQFNNCGVFGPFDVGTGNYELELREYDGTVGSPGQLIPAYQVQIQLVPRNACGNGVLEAGIGEQCDDGNLINGDGCESTCQLPGTVVQGTATPALPIPDNDPTGVSTTLTLPAAPACTIVGLQVPMDISHTWRGDILLTLTSPTGTVVTLHNGTGSSADDIIGTYGTDLTPDGPGTLADFNGQTAAGVWTLFASDDAVGDTGTINSWGLTALCQ